MMVRGLIASALGYFDLQ